jgi:hypothetical protein
MILSSITRFFCICSGANLQVLSDCPTEINKYAGIGGTVFFTGILAGISGGYAIFTIFHGEPYAVASACLFGPLWGMVIFNLDRYIVSSLNKGKSKWKEWGMALPRVGMALIISLVIAKPLEIRIFKERIDRQIHENMLEKLLSDKGKIDHLFDQTRISEELATLSVQLEKINSSLAKGPEDPAYASLLEQVSAQENHFLGMKAQSQQKIEQLQREIQAIQAKYPNRLFDSKGKLVAESIPAEASRQITYLNQQLYKLYQAIAHDDKKLQLLQDSVKSWKGRHTQNLEAQKKMALLEKEQMLQQKKNADSLANLHISKGHTVSAATFQANFITQLEALGQISGQRFSTMWWASLFISLLFVVVETSPVIVKLMAGKGLYEATLERHEYQTMMANNAHYLQIKNNLATQKYQQLLSEEEKVVQAQAIKPKAKPAIHAVEKQILPAHIEETEEEKGFNLIGKTWKRMENTQAEYYIFRKVYGREQQELVCVGPQGTTTGSWWMNESTTQLSMSLNGQTAHYRLQPHGTTMVDLYHQRTDECFRLTC